MNPQSKVSQKAIILINLILIQVIILVATAYYLYLWFSGYSFIKLFPWTTVAITIVVMSSIISLVDIYLIKEIMRLADKDVEVEITKTRLQDSKNLVDAMRAQRHDYINHLQVVYGLVQLGQPHEVTNYIKQISEELKASGKLVSMVRPEITAILLGKTTHAQQKLIKTTFDINSSLVQLNISVTDLSSILGNLIDNAINALEKVNEADKKIKISVNERNGYYVFDINNSAPVIPQELQSHIFDRGFTTQEGEGHGYGLHIVKQLVEKNGGLVNLISNKEEGTTFIVSLPMNAHTEEVNFKEKDILPENGIRPSFK